MMTAKQIREAMKGEGRAYLCPVQVSGAVRILGARECKGELQVKIGHDGRWHTVLAGEDVWSTRY